MDSKSNHEDNEHVISNEQRHKRERGNELVSDASPPCKRHVRESEEEKSKLFSSNSEVERQDSENEGDKLEAVTSKFSEELGKSLTSYDHMSITVRTDSVESLDESVKSTENLSSCDISLGFNETEFESLESSLLLENSLEDLSVPPLRDEKGNCESRVKSCTVHDPKGKKKKRRNKRKLSQTDHDGGKSKPSTNIRPNYFVGIQISNCEIHKSIVKVQEDIVAFEPLLFKALVDVASSHITLLIARIDDENALSVASSALEEYRKQLENELNNEPLQLTFSGLDHFSNNVLYARMVEDEHYRRLVNVADSVRQFFAEKGVCLPNMKPLNPHLTIAKMSKAPRGKGKSGPRKIEPLSYANFKDLHFGCQIVSSLQLLAMNLPKDEQRYYYCSKEVVFDVETKENGDHRQCCFPRRPIMSSQHHRPFSTKAAVSTTNAQSNVDESIIRAVVAHPWIYDPSHQSYKDNFMKTNSWGEIGQEIGIETSLAKKRWTSLRDRYAELHGVFTEAPCSGPGALTPEPKWPYYSLMDSFMNQHVQRHVTVSAGVGEVRDSSPSSISQSLVDRLDNPASLRSLTPPPPKRRRHNSDETPSTQHDIVDILKKKELEGPQSQPTSTDDDHFTIDLAARLKSLDKKKRSLAKIQIMQLMHNIEFGDE